MSMRILKKTLRIIIYLAIYYPIIDLALLYSFVIRATFTLGKLPRYNDPDPSDLGFNVHYNFVYWNYLAPIPICILIVVVYFILWIIKKKNPLSISIEHFIAFITLMIIEFITIISFGGWFVD